MEKDVRAENCLLPSQVQGSKLGYLQEGEISLFWALGQG